MKIFDDEQKALESYYGRKEIWLDRKCPNSGEIKVLCGNWCPIFRHEETVAGACIVLGCSPSGDRIYLEKEKDNDS